ncbi:class I SAM-dependent methyltransferase [Streptomyces sp. D2-8]|uniref:class I SAM-dependent methyltransferase n=1 Tax=Streptomyces sp. D2-8 TaxID=2707767 RepID=UPI0020BFA042|nr:class I SAM-dependent methyltransferase [Streptomyces sp. D2-8]MCK8433139.1 class I SAM-dependent methyltransferase [Streptomyces sp. D2-8]
MDQAAVPSGAWLTSASGIRDIGCGTGVFALALAERGIEVVGVDPAAAALDVARGKPGGERVRWIHGDATRLPPLAADLATVTGNAAQEIVDPEEWNREPTYGVTDVPGVGAVGCWAELLDVSGPLVTFRWTCVFAADGQTLGSDSTLCFRERQGIEVELAAQGYAVEDVRDAPDRPGRKFVFVARRPETAS